MATKKYSFIGHVKWAKVFRTNQFGKYEIQFYPDEQVRKAIKDTGARLTLKEDEDGFYYTLRRDPSNPYSPGPPVVVDNLGAPLNKFIGNGSKISVEVEVYDYDNKFGKGKASRLNKIQVLELVEYAPPESSEGSEPAAALPPVEAATVEEKPVKAAPKRRPFQS